MDFKAPSEWATALPSRLAVHRETIHDMTRRLPADEQAQWLRKLDRASAAHERTRAALDKLVADARTAGVPLMTIAKHTPYSREWARHIADRIDAERARRSGGASDPPPGPSR